MATTPTLDAPPRAATRFEYLVVPLKEAKSLKKEEDALVPEHLNELEKSLSAELFQARFKNFTNRLNDTASIRKTRRDLARVKTMLTQRNAAGGEKA